MEIEQGYEEIAKAFDSIRDDSMIQRRWWTNSTTTKPTSSRLANVWMKLTPGDIAVRFIFFTRQTEPKTSPETQTHDTLKLAVTLLFPSNGRETPALRSIKRKR
jgi:hypothetical protein